MDKEPGLSPKLRRFLFWYCIIILVTVGVILWLIHGIS